MKNVFFIIGLIFGVSLAVVGIGYILSSQVDYIDLINRKVVIADDDKALLLVNEDEEVSFEYTIENWRGQVKGDWDDFFDEPLEVDGVTITPNSFSRFTTASPFPDGVKSIVFSVSTYAMPIDFSLFWVLNIGTREIRFLGEENRGIVGDITWSPEGTHFAYFLNTERAPGEHLTIDNAETLEKEFTLSGEEILEALEVEYDEDYKPEFRGLRWGQDGKRLFFATDDVEEDTSVTWSIDLEGESLRKEI